MHHCYICKLHKPAEDFGKDRSRGSGLMSKCRDCHRERQRAKRQTLEEKVKRVLLARKWKRENRIKERAHKAVYKAIREGVLTKPTSYINCASTVKIEGHHDDYGLPLDVRWLCQVCHINHHKGVARATR